MNPDGSQDLSPGAPRPDPEPPPEAPRARGETRHVSIALSVPDCTSCDICVVECPAWCIELESHSEAVPDLPPGARARTHRVLDSFTVDYGRCLFCGICIEECPFDALAWSEVAEPTASGRHDLVRPLTGARRSGATARPSRLVEGLVSPD